jgi:hypothetical protein
MDAIAVLIGILFLSFPLLCLLLFVRLFIWLADHVPNPEIPIPSPLRTIAGKAKHGVYSGLVRSGERVRRWLRGLHAYRYLADHAGKPKGKHEARRR